MEVGQAGRERIPNVKIPDTMDHSKGLEIVAHFSSKFYTFKITSAC